MAECLQCQPRRMMDLHYGPQQEYCNTIQQLGCQRPHTLGCTGDFLQEWCNTNWELRCLRLRTLVCPRDSPLGRCRTTLELHLQPERIQVYWHDMPLVYRYNKWENLFRRIVVCNPWPQQEYPCTKWELASNQN